MSQDTIQVFHGIPIYTYITLHYITLRCVTLRYVTLRYTLNMRYITLYYIHTYIHTYMLYIHTYIQSPDRNYGKKTFQFTGAACL